MADFKFSCPQCGQRIACDTGYAGAQINCPGCQQLITVPQSSGDGAPPVLPPVLPPARAGAAAPIAARTAVAPAPVKKSNTLRNVLVITACVMVFLVFAALGWIGVSKLATKQVAQKSGNPAAMVPAPTVVQQTEALGILTKMQAAYTNLNSLEVSGKSVMTLDMSQLSASDLDPSAKKTKTKKTHRPAGMPKAITNSMEVAFKMERPGLYCVKESSKMTMGPMSMTNLMVAWSPGTTNYSFFLMNNGSFKRYTTVKDRNTAIMSGGQMSLLAMGAMQLFFNDQGDTAKFIHDLGQTEDDSVNGQDCYTLTAKVFGQKLKMWVSKSNYMILQSQLTLGAPVSDSDMDAAFDAFNTKTNMSADEIAKEKAQAKQQAAMMTKIRGTITDTCDDVQANPALSPDDFQYQVPRGTKLTAAQF